jgi:DNA-directed RNA polymerase specialized sigma24 family protein
MAAAGNSAEPDICPAVAALWHTHQRSLLQLAALLTGDSGTAETVVLDSLVALHRFRLCMPTPDGPLPSLRRLVVAGSRRVAGARPLVDGAQGPPPAGGARPPGRPAGTGCEPPAVLPALYRLPAAQREAVVLSLYLDLTAEQAALAMRVRPAAVRRNLALARAALRSALPAPPP